MALTMALSAKRISMTLPERIAAAIAAPSMHRHKCAVCGLEWDCDSIDDKKPERSWKLGPFDKCGITVSAKSNGTGPYCEPCRSAEMLSRYKEHRKLLPKKMRRITSLSYL